MLRDIVGSVFCAATPAHQTEEKNSDEETTRGDSSGYSAKSPDNGSYPQYLHNFS
jgi:hypothetical protein